jgi:hypothetical protein
MGRNSRVHNALKWAAGALGLVTGAYASYVGVTWLRYGHPAPTSTDNADPLLDRFMPVYEVAEPIMFESLHPPKSPSRRRASRT